MTLIPFSPKDYRDRHRDKVQEFFKLFWATHAKLPEFIHLCIARHNLEGTHRLGDVKAPTLVVIGEADTVGSNHMAQSEVLGEAHPRRRDQGSERAIARFFLASAGRDQRLDSGLGQAA